MPVPPQPTPVKEKSRRRWPSAQLLSEAGPGGVLTSYHLIRVYSGEGGRGSPTYHLIILPPTASKQECLTIIQRKLDGENLSLAEK